MLRNRTLPIRTSTPHPSISTRLASTRLPSTLLALALLPSLLAGAAFAQGGRSQIEEVDLEESETLAVEVQDPGIDSQDLARLLLEADTVFASADRPLSLTLYGHLVDILEAELATRGESAGTAESGEGEDGQTLDEDSRAILIHGLLRRAELHLELGEDQLAREGLQRALTLAPETELPAVGPDAPSPELASLFADTRKKTLGEVRFVVDPLDVEVRIDGRMVDITEPVPVLAGLRRIELRRPGCTPIDRELEVAAGRSVSLEMEMERVSPVLRLNTRPREARVFLDGQARGTTQGEAREGFLPQGAIGVYRQDEFSAELVLDGIEPGMRVLEVRKEGYRPYRMELMIDQPIDYQMPPIVLEAQGGQLVFVDFPRDAEILIDGRPTAPDVPGVSRPRVSLPPGEYHVTVVAGGASRMFSTHLKLSDRQAMEVAVRLQPGLAMLGVLGGDQSGRANLGQSLDARLGESSKWALVDRQQDGAEVLRLLGLDAERLRRAAGVPTAGDPAAGDPAAAAIDWAQVQTAMDRRAGGLLYVLAVLDNDLLATSAELWIWPAAPGPPRPDRVRLPLGDPDALRALRRQLDQVVPQRRPWLGAVVIDSDGSGHPVVADVTPAGPAEAAGLRPGDEIVAVAGVAVQSRAELAARIAAAETGETLDLAYRSAGAGNTARLRLGASPSVELDRPDLLPSVAWADLVLQAEKVGPSDRWLVLLDQGLLHLRADDATAAIQVLRGIRAPQTSHGLGQAAVDYWLGLALGRAGSDFRDAARQALEKAAALPGARLEHHDGPFLQPRARARLRLLGPG